MAITITFDTVADAHGFLGMFFDNDAKANLADIFGQDNPIPTPAGAALGSRTVDDHYTRFSAEMLEAGDRVHWAGVKYTFDGTVVDVQDDVWDDDLGTYCTRVRVKRDDTGKVVKLDISETPVGRLTSLD